MRHRNLREVASAYALILPAILMFGVFMIYPFIRNFDLALYRISPYPGHPAHWAGLHQFTSVITSSAFVNSLVSTLLYTLMVVPIGVILGLVLAVAAHQRLRGIGIYRVIFSTTAVSSVAVSALIFGTFLNPVNGVLPSIGFNPNPPILQSPTYALPAMAVIGIWQFVGLSFILFSSALQSLPEEVLEASLVDGATPVRRFWEVTVPLLGPMIFYVLAIGTISALYTFGQMDLLIGPGASAYTHTQTLAYFIYQAVTINPNQGVAASAAIALFVITALITFAQFRFLEKRVHYGS